MNATTVPTTRSLAKAAQADLTMITVEMLRSPQVIFGSPVTPWFQLKFETLYQLLETAFGADANQRVSSLVGDAELGQAPSLSDAFREVQNLAGELDAETWSDEYYRMFDSSQACALNQASYVRRDKGTIIGDVSGFFNAFGWHRNPTRGERPDNLLCQLEFVSVALAMAAQASDVEQRAVVDDALAEFARVHMHDWMPAVCYHLIDSTQIAYYGAVGQWLLLLWNQLTHANQWPIDGSPDGTLSPIIDPENPYECGAPDLVQLQTQDIGGSQFSNQGST